MERRDGPPNSNSLYEKRYNISWYAESARGSRALSRCINYINAKIYSAHLISSIIRDLLWRILSYFCGYLMCEWAIIT